MKKWILIFSFLVIGSCQKKPHTTVEVAEDFVKKFYVSDSYNINDINKYMTLEYIEKYNSLSLKDKQTHEEYIEAMINEIRRVLIENKHDYEIVRKEELGEKDLISTILYDGNGEIFILKTNNEILVALIVEKNKIYSFCTDMYLSSKDKMMPYFFFDEEKLKANK